MNDAPAALELSFSEGERHDRAFLQLFAGCPRCQDTYAKAQLHEFLDGLHVSKVNQAVEDDIFASKLSFNHLRGVTVFAVQNVVLTGDLFALDLTG